MELTEHHELRLGDADWDGHVLPVDPLPKGRVDIAIIGAGIMGAMLAERFAAPDRRVALIDRRPPVTGSTAASTALVMWEMDVPLTHLARTMGIRAAARRWTRVHEAVIRLQDRIEAAHVPCGAMPRPCVYLEGPLLPGDDLAREGEARAAVGLPSIWAEADAVAGRFGIAPRAALISGDSFAVDPVKLAVTMIEHARSRGATVSWPCNVTALDTAPEGIALHTSRGTLVADRAILASGYERAPLFLPPAFSLLSSFAISTAPGAAPLCGKDAMIWEAADPYLYARTDTDGRIIAGGEDVALTAEGPRDSMIGEKAGAIAAKLGALLGGRDIAIERQWTATFGASPDGLPAIGRAQHHDRLWLAAGFGGNGVSFAALAAELLAAEFDGDPDPLASAFDPYRFG